jgi:hypothetical protein
MAAEWTVLYHDPAGAEPPELLLRFASARDIEILSMDSAEAVIHQVNRAIPAALVIQGGGALGAGEAALELCSRIKSDAFTAVLPVAVIVEDDDDARTLPPLERGADEVVVLARGEAEAELRLDLLLRRATRDISVHPTTRLPGTPQIDRDTTARLRRGEPFAFCYADLDYFKEFNDRYGYNRGDRVIYLVSLILRDLVRGLAPGGFVGHIGGTTSSSSFPSTGWKTCARRSSTSSTSSCPSSTRSPTGTPDTSWGGTGGAPSTGCRS